MGLVMRCLAAVILVLGLAACGLSAPRTTVTRPSPVARVGPTLACGSVPVQIPTMPAGAVKTGDFRRVKSLTEPLEAKGETWSLGEDRLWVGVVCGVRSAERFATLVVSGARLAMHHGKPALHWGTPGGARHFMWLESPGTAVYIAATAGIAGKVEEVAATVK